MHNAQIDVEDFLRQAMRGLAGSVSLIATTESNGNRHAMTATSAISLSMAPPSMLVCVNKNAEFNQFMDDKNGFSINVLSLNQLALAHICSSESRGEERFIKGDWREYQGIPYLHEAQSSMICVQDAKFSYGSHDIFVGLVKKVYLNEENNPLIYADGGYRALKNNHLKPSSDGIGEANL